MTAVTSWRASRFDAALSRGLTTYVGRSRELEILDRCLGESSAGLRIVDVVGEPGIGKSRLLHEFRNRLGDTRVFVLAGSCSPDGQQTPFRPFIEVVRTSFHVKIGEAEADALRKLDKSLEALGLASPQNLGLLLNLLGLNPPPGAPQGLDGTLIGRSPIKPRAIRFLPRKSRLFSWSAVACGGRRAGSTTTQ